ncbi:uncharacterized protein isoform X2 [Danio rerio]|uniref:Uncharacterized protein isoform X2 n=1 Tax=Danio rerio TaxID=7955 RepID=A0AC58GUC3_DANRE
MDIFIYIVFLLIMEVQCYNAPTVRVSSDVISEISSVKISCETPAYVTVTQCYFTINREDKNVKVSPSCEQEFSGAELLIWANRKSPQSVDIICYYTTNERGINNPSSHSPAATVTVLDTLQKPFISVSEDDYLPTISCEIPLSVRAEFRCSFYTEDGARLIRSFSQRSQNKENHICIFYPNYSNLFTQSVNSRQISCDYTTAIKTDFTSPRSDTVTIRGLSQARLSASASVLQETDTVELSCNNTEELKMEMCVFNKYEREGDSKLSSSCQLSLTASQISAWSGDQSSSVNITCFYTVRKGHNQTPSPQSDPVTVTVQTSTPTTTAYTTTTAMKTYVSNVQTITAHKDQPISKYKVTWLIVLVCIGIGVILSGFLGIICVCWFASKSCLQCNKMKSTKPDVSSQGIGVSGSGPPELYSLITSAPDTSQPVLEDISVNKKIQGNTKESEDVYHLYSTIPDKPVQSSTGDQEYSLVQMHR